jgi:hypothetical protein
MWRSPVAILVLSALSVISILPFFVDSRTSSSALVARAVGSNYLGFDLNTYPGDPALAVLRKTFTFGGYWLSAPPGAKQNTWVGKRQRMLSEKFGFLILFNGPQGSELKSPTQAIRRGTADSATAVTNAKKEGFSAGAIVFLDIEEGGRLSPQFHKYLQTWIDALARAGYRAGVYCSGMPVKEGQGVTITTADDIRNNLGKRGLAYFIYNDACPPSPGCAISHNPPPPSASGIPYAAVWQFAQSPRRKEFTAHCAATYNSDGNCYASGDTAHAWFLDINTATSPDPSNGRDGQR